MALAALAACGVRPSAPDLAERLAEDPPGAVAADLAALGFVAVAPRPGSGPFPANAPCIEKARGNAMFGIGVVRFCAGPGGAFVYGLQTHSGEPWQTYWPQRGPAGDLR